MAKLWNAYHGYAKHGYELQPPFASTSLIIKPALHDKIVGFSPNQGFETTSHVASEPMAVR